MHHVSRVRIAEFNENFACGLCFCYIIDATTIAECLHSFCRSCLVQYLKLDNCCPLCGQLVHKTKPLDYVHPDNTLQAIIYKMVPGLLKNEIERRREFYASHQGTEPGPDLPEELSLLRLEELSSDVVDNECTSLSVCLQAATRFMYPGSSIGIPAGFKRYLLCNAYMPISHLKKFIRLKFVLPQEQRISIFYADEDLPDYYTLTDIAELYSWRRTAPLDLFYIVCNAGTSQKTARLLWSRRRLKYSKKYSRYRHASKLNKRKPSSSSDAVDICARSTIEGIPLVEDSSSNFGLESSQLSNNSCDTDRTGRSAPSQDKSLTPCSSAFTPVDSSKRTPSIWRLVDDRMERSVPEPDGDSTNMNAQIFSRSEKETLYSPRFFGDRRTASEATDGNSETNVSDDVDYHFRPIFSAEVAAAASTSDSRTTLVGAKISPKPVHPHFKKRLLLGTSAATQLDRHRCRLSPAVVCSSPRSSSFAIHQDQPSPSPSRLLPSPRCLQDTTNTSTTTPASAAVPAKIGIVISHGRAMTLQDKLQRMSNSSSPAPTLSSMWNGSGTTVGTAASPSMAVVHRKQAVGHRSRDKVRKNSRRKNRIKSLPAKVRLSNAVQNEVENETRRHLPATHGSVRRPCHRKRSELQLLLQLDGGPLAASAEFRRANALRCRDNQQSWTTATPFCSSRPGSCVEARSEAENREASSDGRRSIPEVQLPTERVGLFDLMSPAIRLGS